MLLNFRNPRQFDPKNVGLIHFIGIGGIGMSGIAEILHSLGYDVQGSDQSDNYNVKRLSDKGMNVCVGHAAENVDAANVVVVSSAIKPDNPELVAARQKRLPIVKRAEMLGELMRLKWSVAIGGTHGKTTTTSLVAALFDAAKMDPTVINGGIINDYGTNARLGSGEWMVVESDESDGSFMRLPATVAVVTNIDPEHMDYYGDMDSVRKAYETFVGNIPFYGFGVLCADHPEVMNLRGRMTDRTIITYGFSPQADVRATDMRMSPEGSVFTVTFRLPGEEEKVLRDVALSLVGQHNIQNATAALAIGHRLGFSEQVLRQGLGNFGGVKRRFTRTGVVGGVRVIDDYGHHPTEIAATLRAARLANGTGRVIAVVQPHRYTRLSGLMNDFATCFADADVVIVADVYAAGEAPIEGATRDVLAEKMRAHGQREVFTLDSPDDLARMIREKSHSGDMVVCLGAGSISQWAHALPDQLKKLAEAAA